MAEGPDCLVAVLGRGCERFQLLGEERIPFDDREVIRQVLKKSPLRRRKRA